MVVMNLGFMATWHYEDNESNVYEFITYDYHSRLIKIKLISKEQAELIYNNYNLSDKNLVECE